MEPQGLEERSGGHVSMEPQKAGGRGGMEASSRGLEGV
jgi:hypothetical protein